MPYIAIKIAATNAKGLAVATAIRNNTTVITSFYELIKASSYVCTVNKAFVDLLL